MVLSIADLDLALGDPGLGHGPDQGQDPAQDQGPHQHHVQDHDQEVPIKGSLKGIQDPEANLYPKTNQREIGEILVEVQLEGPAQEA